MSRPAVVIAVTLAMGLAAGSARAGGAAVEVWSGERADDAGDLLAPLFAEIGKRGATTGGALRQQVEGRLSAPAAPVSAEQMSQAGKLVARGVQALAAGQAAEVLRILPAAVQVFRAAPATLADDPRLRQLAFQAELALGVAHHQVGNRAEAAAFVARALRDYPDLDPGKLGLPADATGLIADARRWLKSQGTGKLIVEVTAPGAEIYVLTARAGAASAGVDLPPGLTTVHARVDGQIGRAHEVKLAAGKTTTLRIDWELDRSLRTGEHGVALTFADDRARIAGEAKLAVALARALGAGEIVVAGVRDHGGKRAIVASVYSAKDGALLLAGAAPIEPLAGAAARARHLARYLAGEPPDPSIEPITTAEGGQTAKLKVSARPGRSLRKLWAGGAVVVGLGAVAAGVVLMVLDGSGTCTLSGQQTQCPRVHDTLWPGIGAAAAGTAVTALGVWLWMRGGGKEGRALSLRPSSGGTSLVLTGTF